MFYQAETIDNILMCVVCETRIKDPRLLPCGQSICNLCVDIIADTAKVKVKCQSCGKCHEIPHEGFPLNQTISDILSLQPQDVNLDSRHLNELKTISERMNKKRDYLESILEGK
jgi:hypothetical protein